MLAGMRIITGQRGSLLARCYSRSVPSAATVLTVGVSPICKTTIENRHHEVIQVPLQHRSEALAVIHKCEGLVDSSPNFMFAMTEGFTRGGSRLRVIGVPAGKKIDEPYIDAATKQGILIVRTYDNGEISKESLLIEHIAEHAVKGKEFRGTELEGRTIGFLGVGPSSLNAAIWCREFGMKTIGCDVFLSGKSVAEKGLIPATLSDLLSTSDFLVIDTPLTDCTMPLVNADLIHYCRPGAQIINASRAEVVHEPSLLRALQKGHVHSASLDLLQVASKESATGALRSHPRVRVAKIPGSATFDLQEDFYRQFDANIFGSDKIAEAREAAQSVCDVLDGMGSAAIINAPALDESMDEKPVFLNLADELGASAAAILSDACKLTCVTITVRGDSFATDFPLAYAVRACVLRGVLKHAKLLDTSLQYTVDTATAMGLRAHLHREAKRSSDAPGTDVITVHVHAHTDDHPSSHDTQTANDAKPRLCGKEATLEGTVFAGKTRLITSTWTKDHYT